MMRLFLMQKKARAFINANIKVSRYSVKRS